MMTWEGSQNILGFTGLVSILAYLILLVFKYRLASERLSQVEMLVENELDITVMQPVLSGDPQLESMFDINLRNTPESVCFLWLIDRDDQVAFEITQRLIRQYPGRACSLACEPAPASWNPKSYKLNLGIAHVKSEYVAVLDDDTSIPNCNLDRAIAILQHADLYTGLPLFRSSPGIGSQLVTHFVNNNSLMTYLASAQIMAPVTINGMFYVGRTNYLRSLRAFELIGNQLCDDLALAQLISASGGVIHQGLTPLELRMTVGGLKHYLSVMHRWFVFAEILVAQQPLQRKLQLAVLLGLPALLFWGSVLALFLGPISLAPLVLLSLIRYGLIRKLVRKTKTRNIPLNFLWSTVSELLQPFHLFHALIYKKIVWRNHSIQVHRDGTFEYLET